MEEERKDAFDEIHEKLKEAAEEEGCKVTEMFPEEPKSKFGVGAFVLTVGAAATVGYGLYKGVKTVKSWLTKKKEEKTVEEETKVIEGVFPDETEDPEPELEDSQEEVVETKTSKRSRKN